VGIVDGLLIDIKAPILSEPRLGYVIPVEALSSTAILMQLGEIESPFKRKVVDAEKVNQTPPPPIPKELKQEFNTLVIDPGHGGYDVGTKHGKLEEKDISLFYAISLRDSLKKVMPDLNVILTRETNDFVSLNDRSKIANQKNADLFLSLHVNHAPNEKIFGAETYILNPNATDDDAKKTAMLENDTFLKSLKEKETKASKGTVLKILAEMEQTKYIQKSAYAAAFVQQELSALNATLGLKNRGVKQAMFYVLSQVAMPSVLVEMGFLSNPGDRSRLMDLKFRDEFTQKLIKALIRYREHLKSGT
jgi:N-acetylmuramoyl-L-alanine amidase